MPVVTPERSLQLLVHHDDAEREYAYDGGTEKALQLAAQEELDRRQHEERLEDRVLAVRSAHQTILVG